MSTTASRQKLSVKTADRSPEDARFVRRNKTDEFIFRLIFFMFQFVFGAEVSTTAVCMSFIGFFLRVPSVH